MISRTTLIGGGIILLVCLACVLPVLALDFNPLSYIIKQPTPVPTVNKIAVRPAVSAVPVRTGTQVTRVTTPVPRMTFATSAPVKAVTAATTQQNAPAVLEGVVTEIIYYDFQGRFLAVLKQSGTGEEVFITAQMWEDSPDATLLVLEILQTAYLKGNLVKVYYYGQPEIFSYPTYYGTKETKLYKIEFIILGPVHPA